MYKKQYGGKIIGTGQDGCVFSEPAWACAKPLANYDPSDPTIVSKIVTNTDNEDELIRFALSIVSDKPEHFITLLGTCSPIKNGEASNKSDLEKQLKHLQQKIQKQQQQQKKDQVTIDNYTPTACEKLSQSIQLIQQEYKVIATKRYAQTLKQYVSQHKKNPNIIPVFLKSAAKFAVILERLATGNDKVFINLDSHASNLFMNPGPSGEPIMGMADFGRCAVHNSVHYNSFEELNNQVFKYIATYLPSFEYPVIPFEAKIYSVILNNYNSFIHHEHGGLQYVIPDIAKGIMQYEKSEDTTPFSIFHEEADVVNILTKYYTPFIQLMWQTLENRTNDINCIEVYRYFFVTAFHTTGFLHVIYQQLTKFKLPPHGLAGDLYNYLMYDAPINPNKTIYHKLYTFYFDTLLFPHKIIINNNDMPVSYKDYYDAIKRKTTSFSDDFAKVVDEQTQTQVIIPKLPISKLPQTSVRNITRPPVIPAIPAIPAVSSSASSKYNIATSKGVNTPRPQPLQVIQPPQRQPIQLPQRQQQPLQVIQPPPRQPIQLPPRQPIQLPQPIIPKLPHISVRNITRPPAVPSVPSVPSNIQKRLNNLKKRPQTRATVKTMKNILNKYKIAPVT